MRLESFHNGFHLSDFLNGGGIMKGYQARLWKGAISVAIGSDEAGV